MPSEFSIRRVAVWVAFAVGVVVLAIGAWVGGVGAGTADDPLQANGTIAFDDAQYYPSSEKVRIVVARGAGEPSRYKIISFDEFAQRQCHRAAIERVQAEIGDRYNDSDGFVGSGRGRHAISVYATVDPWTHPNYFHLLHAFPERVNVTLQYAGGTETCSVPIHIDSRSPVAART